MNNAEKIEAAGKKKDEGNALFKSGKYVKASKRYEKVLYFIEPYILPTVLLRLIYGEPIELLLFSHLLVLLGSKVY